MAEAGFLSLSALLGQSPWGQPHNKVICKAEKVHNPTKDQFWVGGYFALCYREKKKKKASKSNWLTRCYIKSPNEPNSVWATDTGTMLQYDVTMNNLRLSLLNFAFLTQGVWHLTSLHGSWLGVLCGKGSHLHGNWLWFPRSREVRRERAKEVIAGGGSLVFVILHSEWGPGDGWTHCHKLKFQDQNCLL